MATNVKSSAVGQPEPPFISNMYERWTLDCIIEVVQAVAVDFVNRPRQYREVPQGVSTILQNFRFHTGTDPLFSNYMQRLMTFGAMLGPSDGIHMKMAEPATSGTTGAEMMNEDTAQFQMDSARLRETARAFVERQVTQGEGQLLQAFLDEAITLQSYLQTLNDDNNVVIISNTQTKAIFDDAANVLRSLEVGLVFGRPPAPQGAWPLEGIFDANGARLVEEIAKAFPTKLQMISQSKFIVIQRIASFGARTVTSVLAGDLSSDPTEPIASRLERFERSIQDAYSWKTALDHLGTV